MKEIDCTLDRIILEKQLSHNRTVFSKITEAAKSSFDSSNLVRSVVLSHIASRFAVKMHPGLFTSPQLESLLNNVARSSSFQTKPSKKFSATGLESICHVISKAYSVGGHTRVLMRWISSTKNEFNNFVIFTSQSKLPANVAKFLRENGIAYFSLATTPDMIEKSLKLRTICEANADIVVLHIHMFDPTANIAFGEGFTKPVIFFNHADHLYWLGSSIADTVASTRHQALELSTTRRSNGKNVLLPLPLESYYQRNLNVSKSSIGVPESKIILTSMASEYKYTPVLGESLLPKIALLLEKNSNLLFIAIGAVPSGAFKPLKDKFKTQVMLLGSVPDPRPYLSATDIYLNSYPLPSITATLDAAVLGIPIVSIKNPLDPFFSLDDPAFLNITEIQLTPTEFQDTVTNLIRDKEYRRDLGTQVMDNVSTVHSPESWGGRIATIYKGCNHHSTDNGLNDNQRSFQNIDFALTQMQNHWNSRVPQLSVDSLWIRAVSNGLYDLPLWLKMLEFTVFNKIRQTRDY